jgi:hypothetical protein
MVAQIARETAALHCGGKEIIMNAAKLHFSNAQAKRAY